MLLLLGYTSGASNKGGLEPGWRLQSRLLSSIARVVSAAPVAVQALFDLGLPRLLREILADYVRCDVETVSDDSSGVRWEPSPLAHDRTGEERLLAALGLAAAMLPPPSRKGGKGKGSSAQQGKYLSPGDEKELPRRATKESSLGDENGSSPEGRKESSPEDRDGLALAESGPKNASVLSCGGRDDHDQRRMVKVDSMDVDSDTPDGFKDPEASKSKLTLKLKLSAFEERVEGSKNHHGDVSGDDGNDDERLMPPELEEAAVAAAAAAAATRNGRKTGRPKELGSRGLDTGGVPDAPTRECDSVSIAAVVATSGSSREGSNQGSGDWSPNAHVDVDGSGGSLTGRAKNGVDGASLSADSAAESKLGENSVNSSSITCGSSGHDGEMEGAAGTVDNEVAGTFKAQSGDSASQNEMSDDEVVEDQIDVAAAVAKSQSQDRANHEAFAHSVAESEARAKKVAEDALKAAAADAAAAASAARAAREAAAAEAAAVAAASGGLEWSCSACTFINHGGRSCEVCGTVNASASALGGFGVGGGEIFGGGGVLEVRRREMEEFFTYQNLYKTRNQVSEEFKLRRTCSIWYLRIG